MGNKHDAKKQSCEVTGKVVRTDTFGPTSFSSSLPTNNTARAYEAKLHLLKKVDSKNSDVPFSNLTNSSMVNSPTLDIKMTENTPPVSCPSKRLINFTDKDKLFEIA